MNSFSMNLGDWQLEVLDGGSLALDGGAMFGSVPRVLWERLIPPDESHRIPLAMRLLILRNARAGHVVLVDTGIGDKIDEKFRDLFGIRNPTSLAGATPLAGALSSASLLVENITHVVLTHLHFDHAGGASTLDGTEICPVFPNAEHFLQRANLEEAESPNPRERASYLKENWQALRGVSLTLVDGDAEILPGLRVEPSDGHTRGMQTLRIEGGGRVAYFVADLAPTSHHVRIPFTMGYDLSPRTIMDEKRKLWERVIEEEATLIFEHDPEVPAGRLAFDGKKYRLDRI